MEDNIRAIRALYDGLVLGQPKPPEFVAPPEPPPTAVLNQADIEYFAILDELRHIKEKRGSVYGHFSEDYERVAALHELVLNKGLTAKDSLMQMVLIKLSRLAVTPGHEDSILDAVNYFLFIVAIQRAENTKLVE